MKKFGTIIGDLDVDILITSLNFSESYKVLYPGDTFTIESTIYPSNATNMTLHWTSSNETVAKVEANGSVTALTPGFSYVKAETTDGSNLSSTCNVYVRIPATEIQLNEANLIIPVGQYKTIVATILPYNADNHNLSWESSDPTIASVNQNGIVFANKEGKVSIIVSCSEGPKVSATCNIEVVVPILGIILNPNQLVIEVGKQENIDIKIEPANATNQQITWESEDSSIATIENGVVKAHNVGHTFIIAQAQDGFGASTKCEVTVVDTSGIENILFENEEYVKIYNLEGNLIYQGLYDNSNLERGIYVFKQKKQNFQGLYRIKGNSYDDILALSDTTEGGELFCDRWS